MYTFKYWSGSCWKLRKKCFLEEWRKEDKLTTLATDWAFAEMPRKYFFGLF